MPSRLVLPVNTRLGGLAGAAAFLLIEEVLVSYTIYWQMGLGAVLLAVVLLAPNGLMSLRSGKKEQA